MRPKKRILIASSNADQGSIHAYRLAVNGYAVTECEIGIGAVAALRTQKFELLLLVCPTDDTLLRIARRADRDLRVVTISRPGLAELPYEADENLPGAVSPSNILDRVKVWTSRKRGPKPVKRALGGADSFKAKAVMA